jgi:hypothetical protein
MTECGNSAAADNLRRGGRLRRLLCRLGLWLVGRCRAPVASPGGVGSTLPKPSEEAQRRMLRKIAKRLGVRRGK